MSEDEVNWEWDAEHSLAKAIRNKAIEECARVVESFLHEWNGIEKIPAAIRALKD